jgi:hypothetical protein
MTEHATQRGAKATYIGELKQQRCSQSLGEAALKLPALVLAALPGLLLAHNLRHAMVLCILFYLLERRAGDIGNAIPL